MFPVIFRDPTWNRNINFAPTQILAETPWFFLPKLLQKELKEHLKRFGCELQAPLLARSQTDFGRLRRLQGLSGMCPPKKSKRGSLMHFTF